ncbi:hypothetical protein GW758_00630 [Candidatus Falkowbacteria bacterium]|nr:hypothetical protein [Candidatus Falkowbacteria bacterium]NCT54450.1 hypothetical protein [Candidatus Falkowbacteria bacterium]
MAVESKPEKTKTENSQKEKALLLKILVLSFTVLIFAAWIFNLRSRFKNVEDLTLVPKNDEFSEIKDDLDQVVEDLNTKLKDDKDSLGQIIEENQEDGLNQGPDQETGVEEELKLLPLAEDPLFKTEPTLKNCPEYINCMPTVGEDARGCAIPPGCEGITQVVW